MPTYQTEQLIQKLEKQTNSFLQKAINEWQLSPPSKLLQQPAENKWSAAQCLEHLNSYGHYYLPAIEKAIETAKQHNWPGKAQFTAGRLGNYFTSMMLPGTDGKKMKKMKAPKNHTPKTDLDADKVVSEFITQQEKLLQLLEKARSTDLEKARAPISIAKFIRLKLGDTFMFLIAHNYRHVLQAERAMEAPAIKREERTAMKSFEV